MRKLFLLAATLLSTSAQAADFPFEGRWACEVANFTFTKSTFNNGSDTIPILRVEKHHARNDYRIEFGKGYAIALHSVVPKRSLTWHSLKSGDTFQCKYLAGE